MHLYTERLELAALTAEQLGLWLSAPQALMERLGCTYDAEPLEGAFRDIVAGQYEITRLDADNYVWHSFFFIIRREDRTVVGSADFKDKPDCRGEVEIGYGLGPSYEHNGFMIETVNAMCGWALSLGCVSAVTAETETDNTASQNVLKRCGFSLQKSGETLWWKLCAPAKP